MNIDDILSDSDLDTFVIHKKNETEPFVDLSNSVFYDRNGNDLMKKFRSKKEKVKPVVDLSNSVYYDRNGNDLMKKFRSKKN